MNGKIKVLGRGLLSCGGRFLSQTQRPLRMVLGTIVKRCGRAGSQRGGIAPVTKVPDCSLKKSISQKAGSGRTKTDPARWLSR